MNIEFIRSRFKEYRRTIEQLEAERDNAAEDARYAQATLRYSVAAAKREKEDEISKLVWLFETNFPLTGDGNTDILLGDSAAL